MRLFPKLAVLMEKPYPTAEVYITVGGQTYLLTVALVPTLPYPAVLGQDVPLKQLCREEYIGATEEAAKQQR